MAAPRQLGSFCRGLGSLPSSSHRPRSLVRAVAGPSSRSSHHRGRRGLSSTSRADETSERIIFSGIQPTGTPHLGNLLGALFNWAELQRREPASTTLYFSIVGWHSLTVPQDPALLLQNRRDMLAALLAVGIDPARSVLFHQNDVPEHLELFWLLACMTNLGKLKRMTALKAKVAQLRSQGAVDDGVDADEESSSNAAVPSSVGLGLLSYPVLQAADILLYGATHVPVGDDQRQHLELSREIATTFNARYAASSQGAVLPSFAFPLPEVILTPTPRVSSLRDPTAKMSKSCPDVASKILLDDDEAMIRDKVKRAVTDSEKQLSYDPVGRPGVTNLLTISAAMENWLSSASAASTTVKPATSTVTPEGIAQRLNTTFGGGSGRLKAHCADLLVQALSPVRAEYARLRQDVGYLDEVERRGRDAARSRAAQTMQRVRQTVGLAS
ncbi:unnamed protein product [Parajaminaea phylloscopi]